MQDPSSYSFKLSDRAGTNIYSPYGDGPVTSGWRALPTSHNTIAPNASLHFSWKGTAITINGLVTSSQGSPAYMLSLDGQPASQELVDEGRAKAEVLLSKTGLSSGYHTVVLSNIAGGNLTVKGLQLSISTGANRTQWSDKSIAATISSNSVYTPNPFFTFTGNWFPEKKSYSPSMLTKATDSAPSVLSFTLSQCSAFFLYGPMIPESGSPYNVKITPPVRASDSSTLALNSTLGQATSTIYTSTQDEVVFWESGMDRNKNYTVDITVLPGFGQWGISKLVTYDATDQALGNNSSSGSSGSSTGLIIGLIITFIVLCMCGGAGSSKKVRSQVTQVWVRVA